MIVGSTALKYYFPNFPREPVDIDIIDSKYNGFEKYTQENKKVEILENPILLKWFEDIYGKVLEYCPPNEMYTLKISHMFWDINWRKHLFDIQWLKDRGCKILKPLFYQLHSYWEDYHGKNKRSNLNMSASDFFTNALQCEYDHDWLHTLINPHPTFNKVLIGEVEVSEEKFEKLSYQEKLDLVQEEIYVMAWERMPNLDYRFSYEYMMKNFIISHAPIWEAIFILDNYKDLYRPKINFKKQIEDEINKSRDIKRIIKKQK